MAFCPKCRGEMAPTQAACPHCGYDFPEPVRRRIPGWVYLVLVAAWIGFLILFRDTLIGQIIVTATFLLALIGIFLRAWDFARGN
jgi:hypothetical protein